MPYRIAGIDVQLAGFDFWPRYGQRRWLPRLLHDFVGRHIGAKNHVKAFLWRASLLDSLSGRATKAECRGSSRHQRLTAPAVRTR
jgi:hypothetical protein